MSDDLQADVDELNKEDNALRAALDVARKAREQSDSEWTELPETSGSVRKRVLVHGQGDQPQPHCACLVHYVGRLRATGEVFMDTRAEGKGEPVTLVAGRAHVLRERCLHITVGTMRVGEKCAMQSDPSYGYGEVGSFSFPSVPPNAALEYEMELLAVSPPEEKRVGDMFYEERLEAAQRRRKEANAVFAAGKFQEALSAYLLALTCVEDDFMMQLEGFFLDQAQMVKAPIHLNMAACQLQLGDWHTAIHNCGEVMALTPPSAVDLRCKALWRRAKARTALGQVDEALTDLLSALLLSPNDATLAAEVQRLKAVRKAELKAVDTLFKDKLKASFAPAADDGRAGGEAPSSGASASAGPSAAAASGGTWSSAMDQPSIGERAFCWFADQVVAFVQYIFRLFGVKVEPERWSSEAGAKKQQ